MTAPVHLRPGPGPRVLLWHGLGGSTASWNGFAAHLDARLDVWAAAPPWGAFGDPTWSRVLDAGAVVRTAAAAVPGGAEVVVAHSFAANVVLEQVAAARLPVSALVLVSPFYRADPDEFDWATIEAYLHGLIDILDEGLAVSAAGRLDPLIRRGMAQRVRERIGPYGWMRFFDAYLRSPLLDLDAVGAPVLVVGGVDDSAAPPRDAVALAKGLPRARVELLADCGHFPMVEQPALTAGLVRDFLALEALLPTDTDNASEPA
jgi:pimeloyl-ACP methyl ester carboxylesterase